MFWLITLYTWKTRTNEYNFSLKKIYFFSRGNGFLSDPMNVSRHLWRKQRIAEFGCGLI